MWVISIIKQSERTVKILSRNTPILGREVGGDADAKEKNNLYVHSCMWIISIIKQSERTVKILSRNTPVVGREVVGDADSKEKKKIEIT